MEKRDARTGESKEYREIIIEAIRAATSEGELRAIIEEYHEYDIASALDGLTREERERLLAAIDDEAAADILAYLEDAGEYLTEVEPEKIADMIEVMDADDAIEVLEELDEGVREEVLRLIEDEEVREDIELIASYPDEVFGSRMSTNFIVIERDADIKGAMRTLVRTAREKDNIHKIFVNDRDGTYYGAIDLAELIVARSEDDLDSLIHTAFPYVFDTDIIDENIEDVRGYDEELIPVIRQSDRAVVGVITSGDIAELVDERIGEDYARLAALGGEEESDERLTKSLGKRLPWLVILLFLGLLVSWVVGLYEGVVAEVPMIVAFQSLILGMAGNVGTQSLAVTVRALGTARRVGVRERAKMIFKEGRVALLSGALMGLISLGIVFGYLSLSGYALPFALTVGGCVGAAMCFAMTVSGLTGVLIPLTLQRVGVDPAVASGPLITTVNDLVAVVSYYGLAGLLLSLALI